MSASSEKGKILETIIKYFLRRHGYYVIPQNIQNYYNVNRKHHGLVVKGRGAWHQIDALGQFSFIIPFVYPIRLLAEAKYRTPTRRKRSIGINIVRDFVGVIKDISENYIIENPNELEYKKSYRFTDAGAIFATMPFSIESQTYAYAHGIYLIPCSTLKDFVDRIYDRKISDTEFSRRYKEFERQINESGFQRLNIIDYGFDIPTHTYFGTVMGLYPIVITSKTEFPVNLFLERDIVNVEIGYEYYNLENEQRILKNFIIRLNGWQGRFELPLFMFTQYFQSENFERNMIYFKENNINYIDIPLIINNMKRIIRMQLDMQWLNEFRRNLDIQKRLENVKIRD